MVKISKFSAKKNCFQSIELYYTWFTFDFDQSGPTSDNGVVQCLVDIKSSLFGQSRVGAPANYNYQSATCPPDPESLNITELNTKKCSVAPNSEPGFISFLLFYE